MTISHVWESALDPQEVKEYTLSFTPELLALDPDDTLIDADWTLDAPAIAAGVEIHNSTFDAAGDATVWLKVALADQASILWDDPGTNFTSGVLVETDGGRKYHRTCQFKVQKR